MQETPPRSCRSDSEIGLALRGKSNTMLVLTGAIFAPNLNREAGGYGADPGSGAEVQAKVARRVAAGEIVSAGCVLCQRW